MSPDYRRPTESPTFAFPEPARAPIVRLWRARSLLRSPLWRSGGLLDVGHLPDSHTPPSLIDHDPRLRPPRPGRVGAGPGPASVAGL